MNLFLSVPLLQAPIKTEMDFHLLVRVRKHVDIRYALTRGFNQRSLKEVDELGSTDLRFKGILIEGILIVIGRSEVKRVRLLRDALEVLVLAWEELVIKTDDGTFRCVA